MATEQRINCPDCGTYLGSKWARTEHERTCPVRQNAEVRHVQEQLEWQRVRIVRFIDEGYRTAARALAAFLNEETETARRMHGWLAEDFADRLRDLEQLSESVTAAQRIHFPRMTNLLSDVRLHIEQMKELAAIVGTLNRIYGARA